MDLAICTEWMFGGAIPAMGERVRAAVALGVPRAEFHLWRDKDIAGTAAALRETGAVLTGICVDPRRSMVDPAEHEELLQAIADSIPVARQLGNAPMIVASGFRRPGVPDEEHVAAAVAVLKRGAKLCEEAGIMLMLEPLNNRVELPNMFLCSTTMGLDIVAAVGSPALKLLFDVYHSAVMDEDIAAVLAGRMHLVHHVQVADAPGRHEPGTGRIDWPHVMAVLRDNGYAGPLGLEYLPTLPPAESLAATRAALGL